MIKNVRRDKSVTAWLHHTYYRSVKLNEDVIEIFLTNESVHPIGVHYSFPKVTPQHSIHSWPAVFLGQLFKKYEIRQKSAIIIYTKKDCTTIIIADLTYK